MMQEMSGDDTQEFEGGVVLFVAVIPAVCLEKLRNIRKILS
jgi:hypothetical protein